MKCAGLSAESSRVHTEMAALRRIKANACRLTNKFGASKGVRIVLISLAAGSCFLVPDVNFSRISIQLLILTGCWCLLQATKMLNEEIAGLVGGLRSSKTSVAAFTRLEQKVEQLEAEAEAAGQLGVCHTSKNSQKHLQSILSESPRRSCVVVVKNLLAIMHCVLRGIRGIVVLVQASKFRVKTPGACVKDDANCLSL